MKTQEILQKCTVDGNSIKLPDIQLDRKEYLEVKKALELIGGKWKGGKTQAFIFKQDPATLLAEIAKGDKRNLKKEFQFFPTPQPLAEHLVYLADIQAHDEVLEPSAGRGAIIAEINKVSSVVPDCYELMELNRIALSESELSFDLIGNDFLNDDGRLSYSKIIANPPFAKNQDITHITTMYKMLARGGRLVTMASKHWINSSNRKETQFRRWLDEVNAEIVEVDAGAFKESGTAIATVIIIINKGLDD